ncbi:hypothetical protein DL96DRAFT_1536587 [Flagelloscypha sp. PMI_526]|nr:hypothetical protein DL96DRAFT_1536587 [Flagelloscypha sp. PMI_526]
MAPIVSTTLNVERLTLNGANKTTIKLDLPLDTPFANLVPHIRPFVDLAPPNLSISLGSKIAPIVTNEPSNHSPADVGGLKINVNEPLVSWYKAYRRAVGLAPQPKDSSKSKVTSKKVQGVNKKDNTIVEWQDSSVTVGAATFRFNRTLRVPDDASSYALPPGLGTFPLVKVEDFASTLPDYISQRGGYIMPLFQREAMWIGISGDQCAIKISVGGINAITGSKQDEEPQNGIQDYVVGGKQRWLDGIATEPSVVRQFVAMKLGHGYTVEEQLSNTATGGIQIDVFPSLAKIVYFFRNNDLKQPMNLDRSPSDHNVGLGGSICVAPTNWPAPETLRDLVRFSTLNPVLNVSYRELPPSPSPNSSSVRIFVISPYHMNPSFRRRKIRYNWPYQIVDRNHGRCISF